MSSRRQTINYSEESTFRSKNLNPNLNSINNQTSFSDSFFLSSSIFLFFCFFFPLRPFDHDGQKAAFTRMDAPTRSPLTAVSITHFKILSHSQ
jgi:hypothetical protein